MASSEITLEALADIGAIPAAEWDACANPKADADSIHQLDTLASPGSASDCQKIAGSSYNPFVSHAFFAAAEASSSACPRTGWGPRHLIAKLDGRIVGVVPCYLKSHSQGEYVFDRGWAEAYHRAGGSYYPKLQVSVPFTPATGPRLLIRGDVDREVIGSALARGLRALCNATEASSVHVTFAREDEARFLGAHGFLQRTDQQFHWHNEGYKTFDDFLGSLNSRHRKAIKRERREAVAAGITIHWLTGTDITEEAWDAFFEFYMETGSRKWGRPYLTRKFFSLIGESMARDVLLVMAKRDGRWIAGAINFIGSDTLFLASPITWLRISGRIWVSATQPRSPASLAALLSPRAIAAKSAPGALSLRCTSSSSCFALSSAALSPSFGAAMKICANWNCRGIRNAARLAS